VSGHFVLSIKYSDSFAEIHEFKFWRIVVGLIRPIHPMTFDFSMERPCSRLWFCLAVALLLSFCATTPLQAAGARWKSMEVETVTLRPNLLPNPGFEETGANGLPTGWAWGRGPTDAICTTDASVVHQGSKSMLFTNGTTFGPHIFGMMWMEKPVRLTQGRTYTMSAWIKSDEPGVFNLIGGGDWQYRVGATDTRGQWLRIATTFKAEQRDLDFVMRLNTESETPGVWVDDVKLEEGDSATVDADRNEGKFLVSLEDFDLTVQGDGDFHRSLIVDAPRPLDGELSLTLADSQPWRQPLHLKTGVWRIKLGGDSSAMPESPQPVHVALIEKDTPLVAVDTTLRFCSATNALLRITALRERLPDLESNLQTVKSKGADTSYPMITLTILKNFVNYAEEDAKHGEVRRAQEQIVDLEAMADRLKTELSEALQGARQFAPVPRWTGSKRTVIQRSAFVGPTRMPDGSIQDRPVFFTGYGHFGRVVDDMEKWPDYGGNIIQIEMGPSRVFPAEGKTNESASRELLGILDRAQKSGVAVCLLISPHYFPEWALKKWPALNVRREGFLGYCTHAPEGRELLRQFIAVLLGPVKDHPALHSICLSNEPVSQEAPCEPATAQWHEWLARRHKDIADLNTATGSNFVSFASVPLPNPFGEQPAKVLWLDYIRFNQEEFAQWHQMLADAVHQVAPALPVHAKAMAWTFVNDTDVKLGVDATLFSRFSNINGNDSVNMYDFGLRGFAQSWELNAGAYDLQRSVLDAPVFNTENHLITDRDTRRVPPAHIRTALWQAAIHGQSATTIWVWERTFDPKSDFAGSIMHRPACAEAVGVTAYDLNRAAEAVTALQQAPAQVQILHSSTALVWEGALHNSYLSKMYMALDFSGLKVGFITERQLEEGIVPQSPVVFVPAVTHLSSAAAATFQKYKGRVVLIGREGLLTKDEMDRDRKWELAVETLVFDLTVPPARVADLVWSRLESWGLKVPVQARGENGLPVWGVECRSVKTDGGTLVNVCNYLKQPVTVKIVSAGGEINGGVDLLTGKRIGSTVTLAPLEFQLIRLDK
jgi:hypothetical protein